jgi:hypothetical protein
MVVAGRSNPVAAGDCRPSTSHFDHGLTELQSALRNAGARKIQINGLTRKRW